MSAEAFSGFKIVASRYVPEDTAYIIGNTLSVHGDRKTRWQRLCWRLRHPFTRCPLAVPFMAKITGLAAARPSEET